MGNDAAAEVELIFVSPSARGHLQSLVETAKLLVKRDARFVATIIVIKPRFDPKPTADSFPELSARFRFVDFSPAESDAGAVSNPMLLFETLKESVKAEVERIVQDLGPNRRFGGMIFDLFCSPMIGVAEPSYVYFASGASVLGFILDIQDPNEYANRSDEIQLPQYGSPIPARLLSILLSQEHSHRFVPMLKRCRESRGVLMNTFPEIEPVGMNSLLGDETHPPVHPIGPIVHIGGGGGDGDNPVHREITKWLDEQPEGSVVFICFGSMGWFADGQIREIAAGLELSGHRFLWSLKKPPPGASLAPATTHYENLDDVFPEGFLQRTAGIGKVIGWAPQAAVLSHPSVGGFVSHCGWNSTLESMWYGVPMAAWPLFAEQHLNAFHLVRDLRVAVEVKLEYQWSRADGGGTTVTAGEVGKAIRVLMEPESEIRSNAKAMKAKSRLAISDNGSSTIFLDKFIDVVMKNIS